ncbi:IQ domain-containing protein K-like [Gigantopelta aegis]|uniref:IQ domain-containing protein K-like n=1 Tax=Gigantopelta aegis TaxID=1735272 RepID=UPI001B888E4D|nr:IQ domain-containing protein K-like [Gigantopelta aegis]
MSVITTVPERNIWEDICKEFASRRPSFQEEDAQSVLTDYSDFDPARHNPVFYGQLHEKITADVDILSELDPAISHPACAGFVFTDKPPQSSPLPPPTPPDKKQCSPHVYLEHYIFPVLLPILEAMLKQAKLEKCFERKRTKFNALDFITEYLYKNNPKYTDREESSLWDIPFVQEWLKDHPRPPLPMSLIWTEEEAALIIQSHWRGYIVRREPDIQELRIWQREWREINRGIHSRVSDFWDKQMPDWDKPTPNVSETALEEENIKAIIHPEPDSEV